MYGVVAGSATEPEGYAAGLGRLGILGAVLWGAALVATWLTIRPVRGPDATAT